MKNPLTTDLSTNLGLLMARIPLGLYFALAGYAHFQTANFSTQYAANLPIWMPAQAGGIYSSALPFLEMAVGGLLILGLLTRVGALLGAGIFAVIVAAAGFQLYPDAGHQMLVMLGLSVLLLCLGGGKFTADNFLFNKKKPAH